VSLSATRHHGLEFPFRERTAQLRPLRVEPAIHLGLRRISIQTGVSFFERMAHQIKIRLHLNQRRSDSDTVFCIKVTMTENKPTPEQGCFTFPPSGLSCACDRGHSSHLAQLRPGQITGTPDYAAGCAPRAEERQALLLAFSREWHRQTRVRVHQPHLRLDQPVAFHACVLTEGFEREAQWSIL